MPTQHALLSPSASARWIACPPSARLEAREPEKDTPFTREGTIAHALAESLLRAALRKNLAAWPEQPTGAGLENLKLQAEAEGLDFEEMLETVSEHYCRPLWEDYMEAKASDPEARLLVEQRLKLDEFIPEGFGSSDAVIIAGTTLRVFDLKYGKGIKVSAKGNPQMRCYALGAYCGPAELYDIHTVSMTIIQPRLRWISTDTMTSSELLAWATDELRPAAVSAYAGAGEFNPGAHCRFCAVAPRCRALASKAATLNTGALDTALMDNAELAGALKNAEGLKSWISSLEAYVLEHALRGETFPGFKVVEGRSVRSISDQQAAMADLAAAGFEESSYIRPKELKTIGDLEKLLRKKGFQELLGKYVVKPQGKPTLAEDTDPRPAIGTAQGAASDFKELL